MARVLIPDHLASVTNNVREVEVIASTYRELVQKLDERFPGAEQAIMGKVAVAIFDGVDEGVGRVIGDVISR